MGDPGVYVSADHDSDDFPSPLAPITINSNGDPSYSPTPTEKEHQQPSKRDPFAVPTQTHYLDSNRFKILTKASLQRQTSKMEWDGPSNPVSQTSTPARRE